jgi:ketosteroid isomerase-like protein
MTETRAAEEIRATEFRRMKALVARDFETARQIIAEDFELIPPSGVVLSREQYLGLLAAGTLRYAIWEAASPIALRLHGDIALVRYKARMELEWQGHKTAGEYWFTDAYERRVGRWQIVLSQGTAAAT